MTIRIKGKSKKLEQKVDTLAHLLGAKEWQFGDCDELGWEYQICFTDVQESTAARQHGGTGEALIRFHTTQAMHRYLDDKIKLFGGKR